MQTKIYTTIDRSNWVAGEWDGEPDKIQWQDVTTGLPCLAVRHPSSGHWCGYVGVSESYLWYGKGYLEIWPEVHGGLTFADSCQPSDSESRGVCHVPDAGEPDHVWWFGFDCAHSGDHSPLDYVYARDRGYPFTISPDSRYRTLEYVQRECASLALQLKAMT